VSHHDVFDLLSAHDEYEENTRSGFKHAPTKYCGNKIESLPHILPLLPELDTFVDVFGGSAQVLLSRKRSKLEVYNDRQSGMAAFYRVLQNRELLDEFITRLDLLQHSRELFYAFKEELDKPEMDLVERAVKWYYIVQTSFGGMAGNFGRVKKPDTPLYDKIHAYVHDFTHFHKRLKGVQIENLDWTDCIKDYDSHGTVFYLDPPYWESNQYAHIMTKGDHRRMCEMIFDSKGFFALSGYENDVYDQYPWDDVFVFNVKENFSPSEHKHKSRSATRREFLWTKEVT
jgi:DNA adenine methylase